MINWFVIFLLILICIPLIKLIKTKITVGIWSIKVFNSKNLVSRHPGRGILESPTLQASDITDVSAEFVADPFIISHESKYYMFFEVLNKVSGKGLIGLATSKDGEKWIYEKIVLKEKYHLSYPYVFKYNNTFYMIPESCEANKVFLYKAINFPYEWEIVSNLLTGPYVDSSVFQYRDKWWMFAGQNGNLHLFFSDQLETNWVEHPKSPLITDNYVITRPGGRVIVDENKIYRYTQDGKPYYGRAVRVFEINKLSETAYMEKEINLILQGSNNIQDWRTDGMHSIDQLKIKENEWLVAVDGHKLLRRSYLFWKLNRISFKLKKRIIFIPILEIMQSLELSLF